MAGLSDTSPEAERVLREVYRRMPFARRWRQMGAMYHTARVLHAAGLRLRQPAATPDDIHADWVRRAQGDFLPELSRRPTAVGDDDNLRVLQEVIAALTRLNVVYALGGSWASSLLGKMRFTHDADICVEPFPGKEAEFCAAFGDDYYVSLPAAQQAVRQRKSFNVVHTLTGFKVDLFVAKQRAFDATVLLRRCAHALGDSSGAEVYLVSPEDIVLLKLEWYRLGGEASEQQWKDVLGVLEVQAGHLDQAYLDTWASSLGVADLLARARAEADL